MGGGGGWKKRKRKLKTGLFVQYETRQSYTKREKGTDLGARTMMKRQYGTKENESWSSLTVFIGPRCPEVIVQRDCSADIWLLRVPYSFKQTHVRTNPSQECHIIPFDALLKPYNLG